MSSDAGGFSYPYYRAENGTYYGANIILPVGQNQTLKWTTNETDYRVELWHQLVNENSAEVLGNLTEYTGDGAGPQEYIWNANVTTDQVNTSPVFFLWIRSIVAQGELVTGPTSPYFNMSFAIAQQPSASSTFSTTTGTAMPTSNPTTTNGPGPTMTGSPSPDTNTTAIGAGVGGGVGGALLLLGAFWFWRRSRNRKANSAKAAGSNISYDPSDTYSPRPMGAKTPDFDPHASPEVPSWHNDPQDVPTNLPSRR